MGISALGTLLLCVMLLCAADWTIAKPRICIVGGGVAGIVAAHQLRKSSVIGDIVILEGDDHLGGRAWTIRTNVTNTSVDMGAQWLHGIIGHPLYNIARKLGIPTVPEKEPYQYIGSRTGDVMGDSIVNALYNDYGKIITRIGYYQDATNHDIPLESVLNKSWQDVAARLTGPLRNTSSPRARQLFQWIFRSEISDDYGGSLKNLSLWWFDDDATLRGGDNLVSIGLGALVLRGFPTPAPGISVRLNHRVSEIRVNANSTVTLRSIDDVKTLCNAVIVTVSLGVLTSGDIKFSPPLPIHTTTALAHRQLGHVEKFIMEFHARWWPDSNAFFYTSSTPFMAEFYDHTRVVGKPVIVILVAGEERIASVASKTDDEILDLLLANLQLMFPRLTVPRPIFYRAARWVKNPLFKGAWSYNAVGINPAADFANIVKTASPRVVLAGEHTDREYFGTVRGAYWSGVRAAKSILRVFN